VQEAHSLRTLLAPRVLDPAAAAAVGSARLFLDEEDAWAAADWGAYLAGQAQRPGGAASGACRGPEKTCRGDPAGGARQGGGSEQRGRLPAGGGPQEVLVNLSLIPGTGWGHLAHEVLFGLLDDGAALGVAPVFMGEVHPAALAPGAPPPRTKWTRRVPHPVLIGHAAFLTPY
jgi:hypothetical protein